MNFIPLFSIGCGQTNKECRHIANALTLPAIFRDIDRHNKKNEQTLNQLESR